MSNKMSKRYLMYIAQNYSYAVLRPLQQAILARGDQVCWFLEGNEVDGEFLTPNEERLTSIDAVKQWQPDAVFVPGNVVPSFIPGIKVGVFHGFNAGKMNHRGREDHFEIRDCFDLYCSQGPATTLPFIALAEKFGTFNVAETGWPTLDPMFQDINNNPYLSREDKRPTVLFCSTFSKSLSCAPIVYEQIKKLSEKGNWRWLVQFHPKMKSEVVEKYKALESNNLQFVETDNVLPLLQAADVMLCDTSSILIMFLLQGKPVVTFNNSTQSSHLVNVTELDEIEAALAKALTQPPELMSEIEQYCNQIHPFRDGHSSERVLVATDKLIENGIGDLKAKPMNLLRHLKMRKKLSYWKL
ncbi:CDP-glycerol glycerophosphotransferase family protein [Shewanella sp. D64]|uniref:CDP-glycerol glycerophosphotransferase family protein n=1 Tax=unclassified Shewanella TaxID=196818 RepID=UPI0022BA6C1C|nr:MULTISPECIES: CDP-glycerol glycerophosphotransferase family protein [unclassified Shewanella]MEC4727596.1 CDP-glycerol glycerophosphotransferase family protein [Shewanella sp. D64]MEC4739847.1 CDP-glycerol glycerophosphotransferase family protein [Shewanella sp. E94]WBJ95767.1 CDP-glycerol glycerophosphotransferase family protein [Shewanella sp. MTB7]